MLRRPRTGGEKSPATSVTASNLKVIGKDTLRATVNLRIPKWQLIIRGALWCEKGGREWIAFLAREWTDQDGIRKFANIIELPHRETPDRFHGAALAAAHEIAWMR